jgi:alanyl-tRNA synthetase
MQTAEIRETFLRFFESEGHLRVPSASLVPAALDPSVLLTTAGMQPFKPFFLGAEQPPAKRVTDVQRCFRTTDIDQIGLTARHLTFFEMLGNWSFGDYFKEETIPWGWRLSVEGFGFDPDQIWVTVFEGDEDLGLGPDDEAIEIWKRAGIAEERIVRLPRSENFWQGGPTGPCGPCSEMYIDRGEAFGSPGDLPGGDNDRFVEYWNHVFMTYNLAEDGTLTELPMKNIDTGMGVERMAAILQGVDSVFDTDTLRPLIDLAEELSGRKYDDDEPTTRAMRIIADHSRGTAALIADGVVPSNEDRGYVLRRIMRRAIQRGRSIGLESPFMERFAERSLELITPSYPELAGERDNVMRWVRDEEESFGRTLDRGTELLAQLVEHARQDQTSWIAAEDAFRLHDTFGFPYDLTRELLAEEGLSVDDDGFQELMEEQRERARSGTLTDHGSENDHEKVQAFASAAAPSRFVGYEKLSAETSLAAVEPDGDRLLVKLEESPFYAEGGGQVADSGSVRWNGAEAKVLDVFRLGDDQALALEGAGAAPGPGERVEAEVDHVARFATMRNHTATHLLHAALRERLGTHVRQAGSSVRPDKLRFDFTHGAALSPEERRDVEDRVNEWIKESHWVRAMHMSRNEAEELGAMALFGEKYGEWVRMVEVEGVSRELCGGTHVLNSAGVGIFKIVSEGSSAANVRRIEAITGPDAIDYFRKRDDELERAAELLGGGGDPLAAVQRTAARLSELEKDARRASAAGVGDQVANLITNAEEIGGVKVIVHSFGDVDPKELQEISQQVKSSLGGSGAIVLGSSAGGSVGLVASFGADAQENGLKAGEVIREAAAIAGGGGGGRDDFARAGGKDPAKLEAALEQARASIETALRDS